jgi:hypothetical protein
MSREWLALFRLPRHSHLTHAYGRIGSCKNAGCRRAYEGGRSVPFLSPPRLRLANPGTCYKLQPMVEASALPLLLMA